MEDELRERLLKNKLYENCPGCKLDEVKEQQQGLPIKQLASIWIIVLCSALPISSLFPFIYFMPAEKYPSIFSRDSIFGRFPYFLPCFCISLFGLAATSVFFWIPIFPLWAESPRKNGGLSYSTEDVGVVLVITGIGVMLFSLFLYSAMVNITGPRMLARIAGVMSVPVLACYPFMAHLSGFSLSVLLNCASIATNILSLPTTTGMFILQNIAVDQDQRGAANGMSLTVISLFRAIGPACGGALFSWARGRQDIHFLPGDHMLFFILNAIEVIGVLMTFKPFLLERQE